MMGAVRSFSVRRTASIHPRSQDPRALIAGEGLRGRVRAAERGICGLGGLRGSSFFWSVDLLSHGRPRRKNRQSSALTAFWELEGFHA